jgi:hypothetical protein
MAVRGGMQPSVLLSHNRTVRSSDAEASLEPSGENVTDLTHSEWPSSVAMWTPVFPCHSRTVLSLDPDASHKSSAENATDET